MRACAIRAKAGLQHQVSERPSLMPADTHESRPSRHFGIEAEPTLPVLERIGDPELLFDDLAVLKVLGVQNFAARM